MLPVSLISDTTPIENPPLVVQEVDHGFGGAERSLSPHSDAPFLAYLRGEKVSVRLFLDSDWSVALLETLLESRRVGAGNLNVISATVGGRS